MSTTAATRQTYFVTGDGLEGNLRDSFTGNTADTIARRLFGRDAITAPGEFVAWVDVYLPLKERRGNTVITTGRVWVGTMRPVAS